MKKLLLSLSLFFAYLGSNAQGVWVSQATGFSSASTGIRNISVVDTNTVWVSVYDGAPGSAGLPRQDYSRTVDGGAHWVADTVPTSAIWDWAMIEAISDSTAWAVFFNAAVSPVGLGQIWKTTDGGATWTQQGLNIYNTTAQSFPNVIHFWNDSDGVIIGDPVNNVYEIYTTNNGGTTWDSVPSANIPAPLNVDEAGWTTHVDNLFHGDTIWFDTNFGRVFRSIDRGHTWTASNTNLINFRGSIDICFYGDSAGVARYYNDTTLTNNAVETSNGGATWTAFTPVGDFFGADFKEVPGTDSMLVSTGVSSVSGYIGTSYSMNGGHTWTTLETDDQRNVLGIADSLTMWSGGFSQTPTSGGIFKWLVIDPVSCSDTLVSPGITSASDTALCGGDTLTVTTTGAYAPVNGDFSGISWVISTADITGSLNPLLEASFLTSYRITFPAPSTHDRTFINDGTVIDGFNFPYGVYYWTPVVFANATAATTPVEFFQDLNLDNNCTFTGNSIPVNILNPAVCNLVGVNEISGNQLSVFSSMTDRNTLNVLINSVAYGKASIQIMDLTGRIVKDSKYYVTKGSNHELINVADLSAGTYIIKAEVNGNRATNKVVKY